METLRATLATTALNLSGYENHFLQTSTKAQAFSDPLTDGGQFSSGRRQPAQRPGNPAK